MGLLEDTRVEVASVLDQAVATVDEVSTALWERLEFEMQHQAQTYWCWAATSVSVSRFYDDGSLWTQCRMVNEERNRTTCCEDGGSKQCNVTNVLDSPLRRAGVLDEQREEAVGFEDIRREIDAGRPVAWRIEWPDQKGHFAVIEGYRDGERRLVAIEDPWTGSVDVSFEAIAGGEYQGNGRWTHTYLTRSPS
jgi:DNA-binding transcriptional ArsR family regulator